MKIHTTLVIGSVLCFVAAAGHCRAATFYTEFTVAGFPVSNGNAAPTDSVSGTVVWTAADIHANIQSFVSINLTLDGHSYSVGEIGYYRLDSPPTWNGIGGLTGGGADGIANGHDDFWIQWDSASLTPVSFAYSSSERSGIWQVFTRNDPTCFEAFSIVPAPEPRPTTLLIVASLGLVARWRAGRQIGSGG
jgi:hypothetical protein